MERAKENFLVIAELKYIFAMVRVSELFDKDNPQKDLFSVEELLLIG
jgi:hypothetical protein